MSQREIEARVKHSKTAVQKVIAHSWLKIQSAKPGPKPKLSPACTRLLIRNVLEEKLSASEAVHKMELCVSVPTVQHLLQYNANLEYVKMRPVLI